MDNKRIQLTLFTNPDAAAIIEAVREKYNPVQFALIKSHVTLCREDELTQLPAVMQNLYQLNSGSITICFGKPIRFDNGKGLMLPAIDKTAGFDLLRKKILRGIIAEPRRQQPHITLMHPRNATCTDSVFDEISSLPLPAILHFTTISLIEQENGEEWKTLQTFSIQQ